MMYLSTLYLEAEKADIGEIERDWAGSHVEIEGEVVSMFESGGNQFLDIEDSTGEISIADFDSETELKTGDNLHIKGRVDIYEGSLQVIADDIVKSN